MGRRSLSFFAGISLLLGLTSPASAGDVAHSQVVSVRPISTTVQVPYAGDGKPVTEVSDLAAGANGTMLGVGHIPLIVDPGHGSKSCGNFFETDASGSISNCWATFNGNVEGIATTPDRKYAFLAGSFTRVTVGGTSLTTRVAKLDLTSRRLVRSFRPTMDARTINDVQVFKNQVFVGGYFTSPRKALASFDASTGQLTGYLNLNVFGDVDPEIHSPTHVYRIAVSPRGDRAIVMGNFTSVGGAQRHNVVMLNLGTSSATVNPWYSSKFMLDCQRENPHWDKFAAYLRGVDFSPDGRFFTITTTGALSVFPFLCDSVSRWAVGDNPNSIPLWINYSLSDTFHGVLDTGSVIYVGGHQKHLNKMIYRNDIRVQNVQMVERYGIGAINPVTGEALSWNPTRDRGKGARAFLATPGGICVGSDTGYKAVKLGGEYHPGFGCFGFPR